MRPSIGTSSFRPEPILLEAREDLGKPGGDFGGSDRLYLNIIDINGAGGCETS
jgi:hypothetical protein